MLRRSTTRFDSSSRLARERAASNWSLHPTNAALALPSVRSDPRAQSLSSALRPPLQPLALWVGASYVVPLAIAGATGFEDHSAWLAVPVAGPFLWQKRSCADARNRLEDSAGCGSMWPLLALPQLTGFTLLAVGLVVRKRHLVRQDLALTVFPSFGGHQVGVVGEF